jgi:hypothetical protein
MVDIRERATQLVLRGEVDRNHQAAALAEAPGDAAIVRRGRLRSIVIACPDGCGDHITINLDNEAGPAWRLYRRPRGLTLFPSVWRESGCRSHFIIWHNAILWCEPFWLHDREPEAQDSSLNARVLSRLTNSYQPYADIALALEEVPWEVARACRALQNEGCVEEAPGSLRGNYRLMRKES